MMITYMYMKSPRPMQKLELTVINDIPPPLPTLKDNKLALGGPVFQLASIL